MFADERNQMQLCATKHGHFIQLLSIKLAIGLLMFSFKLKYITSYNVITTYIHQSFSRRVNQIRSTSYHYVCLDFGASIPIITYIRHA